MDLDLPQNATTGVLGSDGQITFEFDTIPVKTPTTPVSMNSHHQSPSVHLPDGTSRQASPALSVISTLSSTTSMTPPPQTFATALTTGTSSSINPPPAKRRKLTPSEREQKRLEKEAKEQQREQDRKRREEEKQAQAEKKRQENEAKEVKRREKELEKQKKEQEKEEEKRRKDEEKQKKDEEKRQKEQAKEEEKRRKEEEKEKKERAQSRINSFFAKPSTPVKSATSPSATNQSDDNGIDPVSPSKNGSVETPPKLGKSDYEQVFLPYCPSSNTTCAPINVFTWDQAAVAHLQTVLEGAITADLVQSHDGTTQLIRTLDLAPRPLSNEREQIRIAYPSMKEVMSLLLLGSEDNPVDLTSANDLPEGQVDPLSRIPIKYIRFEEDVRPPYIGTYTKIQSKAEARKMSRNPFRKSRPDTQYDYDSEAEWEEPEDGEDLNSEGESEAESLDGEDDMAAFLDDEDAGDAQKAKRKVLSSDMEPVSSGMCWEDCNGRVHQPLTGRIFNLTEYRLEVIQENHKLPIDPFSTSPWPDLDQTTDKVGSNLKAMTNDGQTRLPLQSKPNIMINGVASGINAGNAAQHIIKKPTKAATSAPRLVTGQDLEIFKQEVQGSDHTKVGMLAVLKKKFPKLPIPMLKDTLAAVAERIGRNEAEKRWVLIEPPSVAGEKEA